MHRVPAGLPAPVEHEPEDPLRDLDVLGQQRQELLGGERQRDGGVDGLERLLGRAAFDHRFEADDVRRCDLP